MRALIMIASRGRLLLAAISLVLLITFFIGFVAATYAASPDPSIPPPIPMIAPHPSRTV